MPAGSAPTRYGKYELVERIGMGGMAEVWLAKIAGPSGFEKQMVIKRVLARHGEDASYTEMFLDEARLAAKLSHPNICQVFDLGEESGHYFIAMEHVAGWSLHAVLRELAQRGRSLPLGAIMRVALQLLEALDYAHALTDEKGNSLKLVHRDVTPSNVMVTPQGGVKLIDFGIARATTKQHHTQVGIARGKLGFMSPEQLQAHAMDGRSDLFAVGAVLYLILTGKMPFGDETGAAMQLMKMVKGDFPRPRTLNPQVDARLEAVIVKAMAPLAQNRYRRASEMAAALEEYCTAAGVATGPRTLTEVMQSLLENPAKNPVSNQTAPMLPPVRAGMQLGKPEQTVEAPATRGARAAVPVDTGDIVGSVSQRSPRNEAVKTIVSGELEVISREQPIKTLVNEPIDAGLQKELAKVREARLKAEEKAPARPVPEPRLTQELEHSGGTATLKGEPRGSLVLWGLGGLATVAVIALAGWFLFLREPSQAGDEGRVDPSRVKTVEVVPPKDEPLHVEARPAGKVNPEPPPKVEPPVKVEAPPKVPEPAPVAPTEPKPLTVEVKEVPAKAPAVEPKPAPVVAAQGTTGAAPVVKKRVPKPEVAAPPPVPAGPAGTLAVRTTAPAKVRVDGHVIGPAPQTVSLGEGSHRVVLEYAGDVTHSVLVNIVAGRETPLSDSP
jgi:serine/threonine-protein kinase